MILCGMTFGAISFVVDGEPVAKARPRLSRHGVYTPKKTSDYEKRIAAACRTAIRDMQLLECAIALHIRAYFKPAASTPKYKLPLMDSGDIRPTKKPDADNVAKAICDALNGIAWIDDSQVVTLAVEKFYSQNPRVEVTYWPHSGKDLRVIK